jgi:hypothetical protein
MQRLRRAFSTQEIRCRPVIDETISQCRYLLDLALEYLIADSISIKGEAKALSKYSP